MTTKMAHLTEIEPEEVRDECFERLRREALRVEQDEPELSGLLQNILSPHVNNFEDAVIQIMCHKLLLPTWTDTDTASADTDGIGKDNKYQVSPNGLRKLAHICMKSDILENGWTIGEAIRQDAMAVVERDPAMDTLLEVVLFAKGYMALCCHRVAYRLWHMKRKFGALFMQSQTSAVFGVDIHPLSRIGKGIMMDHATGIVVGETATIGDGCTILHSVTLGGTGKDSGDRHPKVGNHVLIGAGSLLLGNISVGDSAKIGAGSVLLRDIPSHATAVGVPAKIIGRTDESDPGEEVDTMLRRVSLLGRKPSTITTAVSTVSNLSLLEELSSIDSTLDRASVKSNEHGEADNSKNHSGEGEQPRDVDFTGPPKVMQGDEFCPFREYSELARSGTPKDTVNILHLAKALEGERVPQCDLGLSIFEMDRAGRGCIKMKTFLKDGPDVLSRVCGFSSEKANDIVQIAAALVEASESLRS